MAVKAVSEFTIQPDRRDEFVRLFESLVERHFDPCVRPAAMAPRVRVGARVRPREPTTLVLAER
jgi:hypothetical protein